MLNSLPNYLIESSPQSSEAFLPSFYRLVPWTTKSFSSWNISSTFSVSPPTFKLKLYPWRILKQSWLLDWLSSLKALLFKKGLRGFFFGYPRSNKPMSFPLNPLLWCCQNPNTLGWKSVWGYTLIKTGFVLCLTSFEFRVHFNVPFNLEMHNFILRKKKTIVLIKVFMNKVQRASWTTNDSYKTTLWWVKCKWLRNMQIKFPWKHTRASKINGGK